MGLFGGDDEPTLGEAWRMLGDRLGLEVEELGDRSIRAHGQVRGRPIAVEVDGGGSGARKEFFRALFSVNTISSRNQREIWHTVVSVGCTNPSGATGTIASAVDTDDPAWDPRNFDRRNGRHVTSDPPELAAPLLTAETHEELMSLIGDVELQVLPDRVLLDDRSTATRGKGATYVAGSPVHHPQGTLPQPWPERALTGPPWWIDLLCDIAERVDA